MRATIPIHSNCDKALLLPYLRKELLNKGISDVYIENDKLILKNRFFNSQSNMNPFSQVKKGEIHIQLIKK